MSEALRLSPAFPSPSLQQQQHRHRCYTGRKLLSSPSSSHSSSTSIRGSLGGQIVATVPASSSSWASVEEGTLQTRDEEEREHLEVDEALVAVELEAIVGEAQFDRLVAEAQQLEVPVVVLWMANWCRKCIYLKPKLEKLAAEYYPRIRFYCVDVNSVPHRLVKHAGVTKMPTIQLWKDSEKQAEVIGGHKAWLVINEVRQMIENES